MLSVCIKGVDILLEMLAMGKRSVGFLVSSFGLPCNLSGTKPPSAAESRDYFIDAETGNDDNDGTENNPCIRFFWSIYFCGS